MQGVDYIELEDEKIKTILGGIVMPEFDSLGARQEPPEEKKKC